MVLLDSNNSLSAEPIVSTNLTSSSSARNIYIVIEKINSTADYHMNLTYYTSDGSNVIGDIFNPIDSEIGVDESLCSAGTFESEYGSSSCTAAAQGYFVTNPGSISQTPCSPGTYQGLSGQTSCLNTSPGYYLSLIHI